MPSRGRPERLDGNAASRAVALHDMAISVHNLAVEEAAKIADREAGVWNDEYCAESRVARNIADQIRAKLLRAP